MRRLLPVLGLAICLIFAVDLGMALLIIPGIIVNCVFAVSMPACIAERAGVFASMSRSRSLTRGHRWQTFGQVLVVMVGGYALGMISSAVFAPIGQTGILISYAAVRVIISSFNGVLASVCYYELPVAK